MVYDRNGEVDFTLPRDDEERAETLKILNEWEPPETDDWNPLLRREDFKLDEMYVDTGRNPSLRLCGVIGETGMYVNLDFELPREAKDVKRLARNMSEIAGLEVLDQGNTSGLYLAPDDFQEVRTKTADAQGRINMGLDAAGKDLKIVVIEVDE